MLAQSPSNAQQHATKWIKAFDAAFAEANERALAHLFVEESYWRNLSALSWSISTLEGSMTLARELLTRGAAVNAKRFRLDLNRLIPRTNKIAGCDVIEAAIRFETKNGPGEGVVRLLLQEVEEAPALAWTLSTALDMDAICHARRVPVESNVHSRDFSAPSWAKARHLEAAYTDREPDVLVVGGGHGGVTAAAELKRLGYDVLVVDRLPRIGDNWRLRYDGLKLHNTFAVNHFRYMPFPETMPPYLPKDKVANWIESYVDAMDLNFWPGTKFEGGQYDENMDRWNATLRKLDGSRREIRPRHIVVATSVSGTPNRPNIPTLENFQGKILHSSEFGDGKDWSGKSVLVIGSATSAHDICQQLHASDAKAIMVQRSPTLVMSIEPSAELYDQIYVGDGPPLETRDLLNSSLPYPVIKRAHQIITAKVKEIDAPLYQRLKAVGFQLEFGEDDTGWPLKFRNFGGGYYFNVGCSDLIADGDVGLIQAADIEHYTADGLQMKDGTSVHFEAVVLATGFKGHDHMVRSLFGDQVAQRVGRVWGINSTTHELNNMWTKTGQPGLWFTGGAFSMSRIYSRYMALQIDAIERGQLAK